MIAALLLLVMEPEPDDTPWLPPLADLGRFPSGWDASEQLDLYRKHLLWVEWQASLPTLDSRYGADYWREAKHRTLDRLGTWELLAQSHDRLEGFRGWGIPPRVFLGMLRDKLGADYEYGRMPPELQAAQVLPVPVTRLVMPMAQ